MGYTIWRFFNESLRGDTVGSSFLGLWSVTTSQAVSLYLAVGLVCLAGVVIARRLRDPAYAALGRDVPGSSHQPLKQTEPVLGSSTRGTTES